MVRTHHQSAELFAALSAALVSLALLLAMLPGTPVDQTPSDGVAAWVDSSGAGAAPSGPTPTTPVSAFSFTVPPLALLAASEVPIHVAHRASFSLDVLTVAPKMPPPAVRLS